MNNSKKITYILGAGASFEMFPLVDTVPNKHYNRNLASDINFLGEELNDMKFPHGEQNRKKDDISTALKTTGKEAQRFGNIDTYAKFLYHMSHRVPDATEYNKHYEMLKLALTYYFAYKQIALANKSDRRYIHFITSIIDDSHRFPSHVKILNWNYDYQFQKALLYYQPEKSSSENIRSNLINYFPYVGYAGESSNEYFSIIHLNGIAGFYTEESTESNQHKRAGSLYHDIEISTKEKRNYQFLDSFINIWKQKQPLLTFAWEKISSETNLLTNSQHLINTIEGTATLVVIGYSFPFYNREIDNEIFKVIKPTLNRIYYQDPNLNGEFLRDRYKLVKPGELPDEVAISMSRRTVDSTTPTEVEIKWIDQKKHFFIPVEL